MVVFIHAECFYKTYPHDVFSTLLIIVVDLLPLIKLEDDSDSSKHGWAIYTFLGMCLHP